MLLVEERPAPDLREAPATPSAARSDTTRHSRRRDRTRLAHAPPIGFLTLFAFVLLRSYLGTGIPAGTDTLGFIARARESAGAGLGSAWAPAGFGAPRTFTLEQLLGVVTVFTRDAVVTDKLVTFALVLGAALAAYCLAWRISRSRAASTLAGLLYASSPIVLAQWASGHLNVEVAIALLPAQLLLWIECLEQFRFRRALLLGVSFGALLLTRPDMIVLSAATLSVYFVLCLGARRSARGIVRNAALAVPVAVVTALALDAYQLVPALAGVRASWLSGGRLFDVSQLNDHSLRAYQSVAGFAQETGYLGYRGLSTSFSHPWLSYRGYVVVAMLGPMLAFAALAWTRRTVAVRVLCLGLIAGFAAKGTRAPFGGAYLSAVNAFHPLTNFRDPNRWLVLQALSFAVLGAGAAWFVVPKLLERWSPLRGTAGRWLAFGVAGLLLTLPSLPVVVAGLSTYRITGDQRALFGALRNEPGDGLVSSTPYGAAYRFVSVAGYRGYEHDLGAESALFTGKPAVGSGDWGARGAAFVDFTHELLARHDPAFTRLLAANNVEYLLSFKYAAIADRYTTNGRGIPNLATDPYGDLRSAQQMPGLRPVMSNSAGTLFAVAAPAPIVSARPDIATIIGGASGLAAFADARGIDLSQWAPISAGDLLDRGGLDELARVMKMSRIVYLADTSIDDLALASLRPLARLDGVLTGSARANGSTALARTGQLVTRADDDSATRPTTSTAAFTATAGGATEVWARVALSPTPARLVVTVDGRRLGSVLPLSNIATGFAWIDLWRGGLAPGRHRVSVSAEASDFGSAANVTQALVVPAATRRHAEGDVRALLAQQAPKLGYASDPAVEGAVVAPADVYRGAKPVAFSDGSLWHVDDTYRTRASRSKVRAPAAITNMTGDGFRSYFTIAHHDFDVPRDWSRFRYVLVDFIGTASHAHLEVNVLDFDDTRRVSTAFVDDRVGARTIAIPIDAASPSNRLDWSRVGAVTVASPSKQGKVAFGLGPVRLASNPVDVPVNLDLPGAAPHVPVSVQTGAGAPCGTIRAARVDGGTGPVLQASVSASAVADHCRVVVGAIPVSGPAATPPPVKVTQHGRTDYSLSFTLARTSVVSFSRSFDKGWKLTASPATPADHLPVFALVNGYVLPPGTYTASLRYSGDRTVPIGAAVSLLAALLVVALLLVPATRGWSMAALRAELDPRRLRGARARRLEQRRRSRARAWSSALAAALGVSAPAVAFWSIRGAEAVVVAAMLVLPLSWKVFRAIAFCAFAEIAAAVMLRRYGGADLFTVVAILSALRAVIPWLTRVRDDTSNASPMSRANAPLTR